MSILKARRVSLCLAPFAARLAVALVASGLLAASPALAAQGGKTDAKREDYNLQLEQYLRTARALPPPSAVAAPAPWMASMFSDVRARHLNDLVTVRVLENVTATGSADSSLDKDSSGTASLPRLFGIETKYPGWLDPLALAQVGAKTNFTGSGSTARAGSLSATITARVVEVLPNTDLMLEGIREIDINGDRQIIVLTGIVRAADVGPGNVVPSTAVGQMQIRYFGQGLIRDNLRPGWVVRLLNRVF
jgi:flagellar L-ring protein precursor FlgH